MGMKVKNILFILIGTAIYSFALVNINMENNLAEGGFTGITLLLYFIFNINPAISNLILNIPVFIIGWRILGTKSFIYTLIGTVGVSIFLEIAQRFPVQITLHDDMFLAALFAGVIGGIGLGIVFRYGGTTGGVDIVARLVQKKIGWNIGKTMFSFDTCIITLSFITYLTYREAMYTLVAVYVAAKVIDMIQEGTYAAKGATIISPKNREIAKRIITEMGRGATMYKAEGTYTSTEKEVLYCVVSRNELVRLKNLIHSTDPHAFVVVSDAYDVSGQGFTLDLNNQPLK